MTTDSSRPLSIPELPPDVDILTAALAYAECGWYVLPVRRGIEAPRQRRRRPLADKSSRDPQQIAAWFAGTDHGIALHCGRSGAVVLDVDSPAELPDVLRKHLDPAPYQCDPTRHAGPRALRIRAAAGPHHRQRRRPTRRRMGRGPRAQRRHHRRAHRAPRRRRIQLAAHRLCAGAARRARRAARRRLPRHDAATDAQVDAFLKRTDCERPARGAGRSGEGAAQAIRGGRITPSVHGDGDRRGDERGPGRATTRRGRRSMSIRAMFLAEVAKQPALGQAGRRHAAASAAESELARHTVVGGRAGARRRPRRDPHPGRRQDGRPPRLDGPYRNAQRAGRPEEPR